MTASTLLRAESWPVLINHIAGWDWDGSRLTIVPGNDEKKAAAAAINLEGEGSIFTLRDLVERYTVTSLDGANLINLQEIENILGEALEEGITPYLHIDRQRQGYLRALAGFINNFRNTSPLSLGEALADLKIDRSGFREKDLVRIYDAYVQKLDVFGHDFKSALEHFSVRVTRENLPGLLETDPNPQFVFLGFTYMSPLEAELAATLFRNAPGSVFLQCLDSRASEQALRVQQSLAPLLDRAGPWAVTDLADPGCSRDRFGILARSLFQEAPPEEGEHPGPVEIHSSNGRHAEICSVAENIATLMKQGTDPARVRVVAPAYDLYSEIIEEVFPDFGIPCRFEKGMPLLRYPLASLVCNLVRQANIPNPFPLREAIFSSPYTTLRFEASASNLMDYQVTAGTILLPEETLHSLVGRQDKVTVELDYAYLKKTQRTAYQQVNPALETSRLEVVKRYLEMIHGKDVNRLQQELLGCLLQFYALDRAGKLLATGRSGQDPAEFRRGLLHLLERLNIEENIDPGGMFASSKEGDHSPLRAVAEKDRAILAKIIDIIDTAAPGAGEAMLPAPATHNRKEAARLFVKLMEEARLETWLPPGTEQHSVRVEPAEGCQYAYGDHLFLCGMVDGECPPREEFNFLQPRREGLGLGLAYTSVDHARNRLYHLVRSTGEKLYLSRPLAHNGRALPASPFLREFEKILSPDKVSTGVKEQPGERSGSPGRLFSSRNRLIEIGRNVDNNYDAVMPLLREIGTRSMDSLQLVCDILRFDGLTMGTGEFSEFDGIFPRAGEKNRETALWELLNSALDRAFLTAEDIERYASCPLRFFLDNLAGLKKEEDYEPDRAERGTLVRNLLKRYSALAAEAKEIPGNAEHLLREWVEEYFAEQEDSGGDAFEARFRKQLLSGLEETSAARPGLLAAFLAFEKEAPDLLVPFMANMQGFVRVGDREVACEIDRVDLAEAAGMLSLYRYSVANTGDVSKMLRGLHFSLPFALIYLLEMVNSTHPGKNVGAAGTYLVKNPKMIRRGGYLGLECFRARRKSETSEATPFFSGQNDGFFEKNKFVEVLDDIRAKAKKIIALARRGIFHLTLCSETDQSCANCSFNRICRKDQLRLDRLWYTLKQRPDIHTVQPPKER